MADENNPNGSNGKNGNKTGLLEKVTTGVKEDIQALKTDIPPRRGNSSKG